MPFTPKTIKFKTPSGVEIYLAQDPDGDVEVTFYNGSGWLQTIDDRDLIKALGFPVEEPEETEEDGGTLEEVL